jgi:hypothetical protein
LFWVFSKFAGGIVAGYLLFCSLPSPPSPRLSRLQTSKKPKTKYKASAEESVNLPYTEPDVPLQSKCSLMYSAKLKPYDALRGKKLINYLNLIIYLFHISDYKNAVYSCYISRVYSQEILCWKYLISDKQKSAENIYIPLEY